MVTTKKMHRTWCKSCIDWTLHKWIKIDSSNALICDTCKTEDSGYTHSEIPVEKLLEQRQRYNQSKFNKISKIYETLTKPVNPLKTLFENEVKIGIEVEEDDAGQKYIDAKNVKRYNERQEEKQKLRTDFSENYSKINRNDSCPCGSGKKYKKCHLSYFTEKFKEYGINF